MYPVCERTCKGFPLPFDLIKKPASYPDVANRENNPSVWEIIKMGKSMKGNAFKPLSLVRSGCLRFPVGYTLWRSLKNNSYGRASHPGGFIRRLRKVKILIKSRPRASLCSPASVAEWCTENPRYHHSKGVRSEQDHRPALSYEALKSIYHLFDGSG